ncbi:hypothetical protein NDU88_001573 [Pleurodeles waltl]|uniref:Uncharacterized protein n=1 Tax=Pleurodeles waltl TaxID=8319 RepID=A0AAV7V858_PLEWA|nr:hypothetical protein NDU88_001573 [Pleurodeles waltl]
MRSVETPPQHFSLPTSPSSAGRWRLSSKYAPSGSAQLHKQCRRLKRFKGLTHPRGSTGNTLLRIHYCTTTVLIASKESRSLD